LLATLLARKPLGIAFNEHTDADGATVFRHACKLGLEGVVSKRLSPPHRSGPSRVWIKVKNPGSPGDASSARRDMVRISWTRALVDGPPPEPGSSSRAGGVD
jgi:ATP-dependent DNA ligase